MHESLRNFARQNISHRNNNRIALDTRKSLPVSITHFLTTNMVGHSEMKTPILRIRKRFLKLNVVELGQTKVSWGILSAGDLEEST